jgi:hypothetical protein
MRINERPRDGPHKAALTQDLWISLHKHLLSGASSGRKPSHGPKGRSKAANRRFIYFHRLEQPSPPGRHRFSIAEIWFPLRVSDQ